MLLPEPVNGAVPGKDRSMEATKIFRLHPPPCSGKVSTTRDAQGQGARGRCYPGGERPPGCHGARPRELADGFYPQTRQRLLSGAQRAQEGPCAAASSGASGPLAAHLGRSDSSGFNQASVRASGLGRVEREGLAHVGAALREQRAIPARSALLSSKPSYGYCGLTSAGSRNDARSGTHLAAHGGAEAAPRNIGCEVGTTP